MRRIVIVGASVAGLAAADELRQVGHTGEIVILGDETHQPYDRPPLSKSMLVTPAEVEPRTTWLRPDGHVEANGLELRLGVRAVGVDTVARRVRLAGGDHLGYDGLVLATGCRPRTLATTEGAAVPTLRTLDDLAVLRRAATTYSQVTVIGGGFIGLELAGSFKARGLAVQLLSQTARPFEKAMGEGLAADVAELHRHRGVDFEAPVRIAAIRGSEGDYEIELADGRRFSTPFVVAGVGALPNDEWLRDSEIATCDGVLADSAGRTSVPDVVAAGDVAAFEHPRLGRLRIEHWTNAMEQGRHVARTLLGEVHPYSPVPYFWTDQYDRKFQTYGRRRPDDECVVAEGALGTSQVLALYGSDGEFHCVTSCGLPRSLRDYRKLLLREASWAEALDLAASRDAAASA